MITVLEIGGGLLLTTTLLAIAMVVVAFQVGRLAARDDEQREVAAVSVPRIRKPVRAAPSFERMP